MSPVYSPPPSVLRVVNNVDEANSKPRKQSFHGVVEFLASELLNTNATVKDVADKCVSLDFVLLEKVPGGRGALSESIDKFNRNICDLKNCSFRDHLSDAKVLCALVGEWLKDLRDEVEQLQARLKFKRNILGSCHGYPLDDECGNKLVKSTSCPVVTGNELAALDLIRNSLKVGEHTVLLMPSFHYYIKLQHATSPIDFNIIERTNLWSLCEGAEKYTQTSITPIVVSDYFKNLDVPLESLLIVGTPIVVVPSISNELDDTDQAELNNQVFQGLCNALHYIDQGLSDVAQRLAGSEEVIPIPNVSQSFDSTKAKDIRDFVLEIEVRDYNPIQHERGFHQKLNVLVKESLHFGKLMVSSWLKNTILRDSLDANGSMIVDENLRVKGRKNIFSIEDIKNIKEMKQGYFAKKQASVAAKNMKLLLMNEAKAIFAQLSLTTMIGLVPGLIKSKDLFIGKTKKKLDVDSHVVH
ncbi:sperm protamine like protein [Tanacetum coccineum]